MAAAPGLVTSGTGPPNAVVEIQPGMLVEPVVLVDQNGQYVTTSGSAATAGYLADLTGTVNVAAATAPTAGQVLTATGASAATWQASQSGFSNPMTALGDMIAENSVPTAARLAGNTTTTQMFLAQTGTGSASALPQWSTIGTSSLPVIPIAGGGSGQTTATAAYNALSPMTTKGDMEYDSANGTASRLGIGTVNQVLAVGASTVPSWSTGYSLLASTGASGYTLSASSLTTVATWTAPNDGNLHRITVIPLLHMSTTGTGGQVQATWTTPDGTAVNNTPIYAQSQSAGVHTGGVFLFTEANTTVSIVQNTGLSGGAGILWVELWGS